jgi:hypothetical protein
MHFDAFSAAIERGIGQQNGEFVEGDDLARPSAAASSSAGHQTLWATGWCSM